MPGQRHACLLPPKRPPNTPAVPVCGVASVTRCYFCPRSAHEVSHLSLNQDLGRRERVGANHHLMAHTVSFPLVRRPLLGRKNRLIDQAVFPVHLHGTAVLCSLKVGRLPLHNVGIHRSPGGYSARGNVIEARTTQAFRVEPKANAVASVHALLVARLKPANHLVEHLLFALEHGLEALA